MAEKKMQPIKLSHPRTRGSVSIEEALLKRRSVRSYTGVPLSIEDLSQLLWAAQGMSHPRGYRTAPSAGALYPLELLVAAGRVGALSPGVYRYDPHRHEIVLHREGDRRANLRRASLDQSAVGNAPAVLIFCAVYERTTRKYGERGVRYAMMEAGHAAQNVHLQVVSLGLGTVLIGAFRDDQVKSVLELGGNEEPLYLMPVGK
ncbi:SagB/ThcOx family dehydrogenase [Syntrophobacter fumaroxidans]|uniref:Nitroreductase n=1 Tax=Syntrophobacter fumaroxidans (strain DSM 10017 / MPOB) TaxID=335543 RepID=A0LES8_SYNFM|nr:SagB/ThcOx family dehydrogenase [Syntrophobacter fumaroxidans]ABK15930.1 nitroreductase [Syntrophobacter fumaroxidans MPOB]